MSELRSGSSSPLSPGRPADAGAGGERPALDHPSLVTGWEWWIGAVVAAALVGGGILLWRLVRHPDPAPLSSEFIYDVSRYTAIDPALIEYEPAGRIETGLEVVRAVAAGPNDRVLVAGDQAVAILDRRGGERGRLECSAPPRCLAVAPGGGIHVGLRDRIETRGAGGELLSIGESLGPRTLLTSIAVAGGDLYAADAGERTVWHLRVSGEKIGRIGDRSEETNAPGFKIPSPFFDLAMAPDGLLRVVNPGRHQIEAYNPDGTMELAWGKASFRIDGFIGCCNPVHIAILPGGEFVTSEKGAPRVKLYDSQGEFRCVVAGPQQLGADGAARDLAVDREGRILVLDPPTRSVLVFVRKRESPERGEADDGER
ncbi:MAG: hypothetical protein JXA90_08085 [Planctomycetes bacterium]|nr:hypothetical protein [Planctomycetota bacterium]